MLSENSSEIVTNENSADDKNASEEKNDSNENNTQDSEQKKFTLKDAKNLMDKYKTSDLRGDLYINNVSSARQREFAMKNIKISGYISCNEVSKTVAYKDVYGEGNFCENTEKFAYYSYNDVLKSLKKLFGNNATLEKKNDDIDATWQWYYVEEYNSFIKLELGWGGDCPLTTNTLEVYDYEITNDSLYIYTKRTIVSEHEDVKSSVTKNKYTFKKQNTGYYMAAVEKIN